MNIPIFILAAGQSKRLGRPKQLEPFDDSTLLNRTIDVCKSSSFNEVYVVVGAYKEKILASINHQNCKCIFNENWELGIGSSIAAGISILDKKALDGVCIVLADQPFLDVTILEDMYSNIVANGSRVVVCKYDVGNGPPSYFNKELFDALGHLDDDDGAKSVVKANKEFVFYIDFPKGNIDIDTEEDVLKIKEI